MPEIINFADQDGFDLLSMTTAIQKFPNMYGRLNELNLFIPEPVTTTTVVIEEENNVLNLLPTKPYDAPPTYGTIGKRKLRTFAIPHIPHDDVVRAQDVQGVRSFGTQSAAASVNEVYAKKLQTMRNKHAITLEHLRMGALKGIVLDADGTILYNYFTEFDVAQETQNFELTNAATEVLGTKVLGLKRYMEDNLKGETMTGIHVLCSPEFFGSLITHPKITEAYKYFQQRQGVLTDDLRMRFEHGGVVFEEYRGTATDIDGNVRKFIAVNEAIAFPLGTQNTFRTIFAPANYLETVNTPGMELYAKGVPDRYGRSMEILSESNPLPIVKRPELVVKLTRS